MSKLRLINYRMMRSLLLSLGFEQVRQKGSHVFFRHTDGRTTTVPDHGSHDLARPLIRSILRDINLTTDQYNAEIDKL